MNVQDPSDPCFDVKFDSIVSADVMGKISQENVTITLTKTNKKSENFFYRASDGFQNVSLAGQMTYGTPDIPDTPAEVETLVKDELYKLSLGG